MKKYINGLSALVILLTLGLSGCGNEGVKKAEAKAGIEEKNVIIVGNNVGEKDYGLVCIKTQIFGAERSILCQKPK